MCCGMSSIAIVVAGLVALGEVGDLAGPLRWTAAIFLLFIASFGLYHTVRRRKPLHIHISGTGQVRIAAIDEAGIPCEREKWPYVKQDGELVSLLDDSTLWRCMLLLCLRTEGGKLVVVPVLPDGVSRESFRKLSVACRWIAAHVVSPERSNAQV